MDVAWSMNLQPGNGNGIFFYFHFWPGRYRLFSKRPVQKKLAVFANDCVRSLPDNMQCLYDELRRRGYRCILCLKPKHAGNPISATSAFFLQLPAVYLLLCALPLCFFKRLLFPGLFRQAAGGNPGHSALACVRCF